MADFAQAPFLIPPPPEKITATTTHGIDTTESELAPRQIQYFDDQAKLREERGKLAEEQSVQAKAEATIKAENERKLAAELERQEAERAKAFEQTQGEISQWSSRLKEARDRYDNAKTPSLFHDKDTYGNVMKALAFGLSGESDAMRARIAVMTGRPEGPSAVDALVNGDLDRQREAIKMMSDRVVTAKAGLSDAVDARKLLLAEVDARGAMAWKRIGQIGAANLAAQGVSQADIDKHAEIIKARDEELKAQSASVNDLTKKITRQGTDVTITENENKTKKDSEASAAQAQVSPTSIYDVNGNVIAEASTPKLADKLNVGSTENGKGALPAYGDLRDAMVRLQKHYEEHGNLANLDVLGERGRDLIRERNNLYNEVLVAMKGPSKDALGVLTGPDVGIIEGQIGGWADKLTGSGTPQIKEAIAKLDRDAARTLAANGFKDPHKLLARYRGEAPAGQVVEAPPGMFLNKKDIQPGQPTSSTRAPSSGAEKDSPEDVNSQAPLPEDPSAQSIDDFQPPATPKKMPGVAQLKSVPAPAAAPPAAPAEDLRTRTIRKLKANPNLPGAKAVMKQLGITDEDLR